MTLSLKDLRAIRKAGFSNFTIKVDGYIQLKNVDGNCFFLDRGNCSIYDIRPLGCQLYPVIFDPDRGCAIKDTYCPWSDSFIVEKWHHELLKREIQQEDDERDRRRK